MKNSIAKGIQNNLPGVGVACLVAMAATLVSTLHGGPQFLYALFFGVAFHFLSQESKTKPGIEFAARNILRLGVGLLGARITAVQIISLGWTTALIVIFAVITTIACGMLLCKRLGLTQVQGVLSGGSVAICGASAALAISAVLPRDKDSDRFTLMVVVTVTILSTLAMVLYPLLAKALQLSPKLAGLFIGGTIHDVAQVVGAGFSINQATGEVATIVKLFRVAMLAVVVVVISATFKKQRDANDAMQSEKTLQKTALVPWFLWLFVILVVFNSLGWLGGMQLDIHGRHYDFVSFLTLLSRSCLVVAIAALGVKTSFKQLAQAGWRPFVLLLIETVWMAVFVLATIVLQ